MNRYTSDCSDKILQKGVPNGKYYLIKDYFFIFNIDFIFFFQNQYTVKLTFSGIKFYEFDICKYPYKHHTSKM